MLAINCPAAEKGLSRGCPQLYFLFFYYLAPLKKEECKEQPDRLIPIIH